MNTKLVGEFITIDARFSSHALWRDPVAHHPTDSCTGWAWDGDTFLVLAIKPTTTENTWVHLLGSNAVGWALLSERHLDRG